MKDDHLYKFLHKVQISYGITYEEIEVWANWSLLGIYALCEMLYKLGYRQDQKLRMWIREGYDLRGIPNA